MEGARRCAGRELLDTQYRLSTFARLGRPQQIAKKVMGRMAKVFWFTVVALAGLLATQTAATAEPRIGTAVRIVKD